LRTYHEGASFFLTRRRTLFNLFTEKKRGSSQETNVEEARPFEAQNSTTKSSLQ
jgi:hypothetical protein